MRSVLENSEEDFIPLSKEIEINSFFVGMLIRYLSGFFIPVILTLLENELNET